MKKRTIMFLGCFLVISMSSFASVPDLPKLNLSKSMDSDCFDLFIRRCKSREFSKLSRRLTYFEMIYANMQRAADVKSEQEKEKIKFEFGSLAHDIFEWQNENVSFLRDNLLLTDQDDGDESGNTLNFYNENMVPRISDLSRLLQVEIPLICKVINSRPSSSAQVLYSLPDSSDEKEELVLNPLQSSSYRRLEELDKMDSDARLRRTPCMPRTRSSFDASRASSHRSFGDLE
ncbi:MAG: hypothetical protein NTU89_01140 [Candidatus Dependentiae bacterium]|nr:hypothetical protein [Candidatus Dependentiae bacterium]